MTQPKEKSGETGILAAAEKELAELRSMDWKNMDVGQRPKTTQDAKTN